MSSADLVLSYQSTAGPLKTIKYAFYQWTDAMQHVKLFAVQKPR
jgi:hypothetical protein